MPIKTESKREDVDLGDGQVITVIPHEIDPHISSCYFKQSFVGLLATLTNAFYASRSVRRGSSDNELFQTREEALRFLMGMMVFIGKRPECIAHRCAHRTCALREYAEQGERHD